ncbi:expressed unknown protein [Seminavis robusta]|uniref:PDZ domain-containing protein n=1 Tax=Seminavis robusta TaxID=568900 RepID=A0A9N8ECH0_9STRA|nr:expressed unknown protein [Seminavis robusta]|eukprot:Sro743_g196110.1 n/a (569) ;mRNA; f:42887-44593
MAEEVATATKEMAIEAEENEQDDGQDPLVEETNEQAAAVVVHCSDDEEATSIHVSELEWGAATDDPEISDPHRGDEVDSLLDLEAPSPPEPSNFPARAEAVIAEPLDESIRGIPVVKISHRQEEIINVPEIVELDEDDEKAPDDARPNGGVRLARAIRNSVLFKRPQMVSVDVEATPIHEPSVRTVGDSFDEDEEPLPVSQHRVAQFISARVIRKNPTDDLGFKIRMEEEENIFGVTAIKKDGLLANSPILEGDKLISINSQACLGMKLPGIMRLLETATDHVTITCQNPRGDGSLVECYVMRPTPSTKLGIDLTNQPTHRRARRTRTRPVINSVDSEGIMVDSLLNPGDRILSVNGQSVSDTRAVAEVLSKTTSPHVTVLARTKEQTAAIVTTEPEQGTRSRVFDLYGTPARALRLRDGRADTQAYDSARQATNIGAIALAIILVATPARSGVFITGKNWMFAVFALFGIVNVPWFFRKPGQRFSLLQALCNALLLGYMTYVLFVESKDDEEFSTAWFCAFYIPLLLLVNIPVCFVQPEEADGPLDANDHEPTTTDGEDHRVGVCPV